MKRLLAPGIVIILAEAAVALPRRTPADFAVECTTPSDATTMEVYVHGEMVNSFLNVEGKFGLRRFERIHYANEHRLTNHGGTLTQPFGWSTATHEHKLVNWDMMGDVADKNPKVFYLDAGRGGPEALWVKDDSKPRNLSADDLKELTQKLRTGKSTNNTAELLDRPLSDFEAYALAELKKGEHLVKWEQPEFNRFVGPIRAGEMCLKCHPGAKVGDVLGAFTYDYVKTALPTDPFESDKIVVAARTGASWEDLEALEGIKGTPHDRKRYGVSRRIKDTVLSAGIVMPAFLEDQNRIRKDLMERDMEAEMILWEDARRETAGNAAKAK